MKDVQRAISIEEEHIQHRLNGEEPYSLKDKLMELGFSDLEDYFGSKLEHSIQSLDFALTETTPDKGAYITAVNTERGVPSIVFGDTDGVYVFHGTAEFNREYCEQAGIHVIDYNSFGGNIIISEGDLSLGLVFPTTEVTSQYILEHIRDILARHTDSVVEVDNNDVLIAGKKVVGSATYQADTSIGFVAHFSFSDKSELINAICYEIKKPVDYIRCITREQLREEITSWLRRH